MTPRPQPPADPFDDDDDGGITGWEQGDADKQLIPGGGETLNDASLATLGKGALVVAMIIALLYMLASYSGRTGF